MPIARSDLGPEFLSMLIQTLFFKVYDIYVPDDFEPLVTRVTSTKDSEIYPTLGVVPRMTKFTGERKYSGLGNKESFTVKNETYTADLSIPLNSFDDDQYGIVNQRIADLAVEAKRFPVEQIFTLIHNGASTKGYDGKNLFDSHPAKGTATQSNALSTALSATSLQTAISTMKKFVDQTGRPLGMRPDTLIVGPDLEVPAGQLLNSTFFMSYGNSNTSNVPTSNQFGGILKKLVVNEYLTSSTEWYVACTSRPLKPVILQGRKQPDLSIKLDPETSDTVYETDAGSRRRKGQMGVRSGIVADHHPGQHLRPPPFFFLFLGGLHYSILG